MREVINRMYYHINNYTCMKTYMIPATTMLAISANVVICNTSAPTPPTSPVDFKKGDLISGSKGL